MTARNDQTSATESQQIMLARPLTRSRSTGPRTERGKERSKRNSLKHGIFSKALLLEGESQREFERLLKGLCKALKPVGTLEQMLVERIAIEFWKYRRLLVAESAEIRRSTQFVEWDSNCERMTDAVELMDPDRDHPGFVPRRTGLVRHISNSNILRRCIELLRELEENVSDRGFDRENDSGILSQLYGDDAHPYVTAEAEYDTWRQTSESTEEERQEHGYATPEECVANVLDAIKAEIKRLEAHAKFQKKVNASRLTLDRLRGLVPRDPQELDRLLRYAATIDRAIARTLAQLERQQRIRLGQPVLPAIKLDL